jgi:4-amino-4-deoxy-L-arabinose transferase-like glycosyltransferase
LRISSKHLLAVPVLFLLYIFGLTRVGLLGPDEPRYAAVGREMARAGDWVTPRLWGEPWFEKPILLYWMTAFAHRAGLNDELAPRLPVALVSVAFLFFYFHQMRREFGAQAALAASVMLATSAGWLAYSHVAVTDLPLAATFSASMLLAMPWVRSGGRRGLAIAGLLLGAAVLAKGLVPFVLALPLVWVGRRRWADLWLYAAGCIVVAAPWYIACWMQNGDVFLREFIWRHHFGRFVSAELQHVQPFWFYLPVLAGFLFPWTPLLAVFRWCGDWREPRRQLLLAWAVFGLVFFSLATNKLPGYILPLLPAVTAIFGICLVEQKRFHWSLPIAAALLSLIPIVAATLPGALVAGITRAPIEGFTVLGAAASLVVAIAVWWFEKRGHRMVAVCTIAFAMTAAILHLKTDMLPRLDTVASARPLWLAMSENGVIQCIDDLHRSLRYGLHYYAGRELPPCSSQRQRRAVSGQ